MQFISMKKYRFLLFSVLFFCCIHPLFAQKQQLMFADKKNKISICAQYRESNGDMVSAATMEDPVLFNPYMLVFKTDKAGNLLWVFKDTFYNTYERTRIGKLANKDYLVMNAEGRQLLRLKPDDGSMVWTRTVGFSTSINPEIRGFAELPNGNIVVCGYNDNDFTTMSDRQYEGFLVFFDSAGTVLNCKYYGHTKTSITENYCFYDVAYLDNKLYVAGGYGRYFYSVIDDAMLMSMDINGNLLKTGLHKSYMVAGPDTVAPRFTDLSVADGKLYVQGASSTRQLVARIDTATFSLNGYLIRVKPYANYFYFNCQVDIKDSNTFYSQISASHTFPIKKMFLSKIQNGVVSYCKKVERDSLMVINSMFSAADDTVFTGGRINMASKGYSAYFQLSDTSIGCGVSDSMVSVNAFTHAMVSPLNVPKTHSVMMTSYPTYRWGPHCMYSLYLCGDKLCPNDIKAILDTPSKTELCIGDSVLLTSKGCVAKSWYHNGVLINDTADYLYISKVGTYLLIAGNNACTDTATIVFRKKFEPTISQSGDTLFSSEGISYQWLDSSFTLIAGANTQYHIPAVFGTYYVRVTDSNGCQQESDSFVYKNPLSIRQRPHMGLKMLEIFPNPAHSHINVLNQSGSTAVLIIRDLNGKIILSKEQSAGAHEYELSTLGIRSGLYLVQLLNAQFCTTEKIIVIEP